MAETAKGGAAAGKPGAPKKKIRKGVTRGIAHIKDSRRWYVVFDLFDEAHNDYPDHRRTDS